MEQEIFYNTSSEESNKEIKEQSQIDQGIQQEKNDCSTKIEQKDLDNRNVQSLQKRKSKSKNKKKRSKSSRQSFNLIQKNNSSNNQNLPNEKEPNLLKQKRKKLKKIRINYKKFHKIHFNYCDKIDKLVYYSLPQAPKFYQLAFIEIIQDLKYRQQVKENLKKNNTKIRALLVRKVLEDFVRQSSPSYFKRQSTRITAIERKVYQHLGIQIPSSSLNLQYINNLFKHSGFRLFFIDYVTSDRLRLVYLLRCYEDVIQFCKSIDRIASNSCEDEKKLCEFKRLKKPMTLAQVRRYQLEAHQTLDYYCK